MPTYKAPLEDVSFLLNDVFQIDRYDNLPGFTDASADVREAILGEAAKLSEEVLQPLNRTGDLEGCVRHDDGSVTTPTGFKEAFKQVAEGGWLGLSAPAGYGGRTMGATAALMVHGKPEQKTMFVPKMVAGEWTGTMNLTEPQCGTDLGLLRTKAVKQADGSYKITGTKIFISAGEHDLADNIIHLVLARIEGAPAGIKGVSLFVVPKILVNADGSLGARHSDVAHRSSDPKDRQEADDHMGLMTPVMKGVLTDVGFSNAVLAQQMYGGHGYIAEQGMEQFVRDARIAMIYEGANGIQALDLVGRKLPRDGGRAVMAFFGEVGAFAKEHGGDEAMKPFVAPMSTALGHLQQATP